MSTSLLYHAFGVRGYRHVRTRLEEGTVVFVIERPRENFSCSQCGSDDVHSRGTTVRRLRCVPIGGRPAFVECAVPRLYCRSCHAMRQPDLGFADPKKRHTRTSARYVLDFSRFMTLKDVALHLGVSWDTVKEIQRRHLETRSPKPQLQGVRRIAVDEISVGKEHWYVTVVLDLDRGTGVFVGEGKGADALDPFWKRLRAARAKIEAVATDMAAAYTLAVRENLPRATHVFDRFHVVKLFNEQLSELRRELYHEATKLDRPVLKGTRCLLLKNPDNLDERRNERARLEEALKLNALLAAAYYLKEDPRQL